MMKAAVADSTARLLFEGTVESIELTSAKTPPAPWRMIVVDPSSLVTHGSATLGTLNKIEDQLSMDLDWAAVLRASQETSFRFLANEPELCRPEDVEPV
jgi:hypothetical protein